MAYYLWKAALGDTPKLPITKLEYNGFLKAWSTIAEVVYIEEEWDCLIQNFIELEMEMLRSAMNTMVLSHESYHEMVQLRLGFARRLANLLQSCRAYLDHTPHHLNSLAPAGMAAQFKALSSTAYDGSLSYRFMEALRNYAQHRGLPLHGATFDTGWTGDFSNDGKNHGMLRHSVAANIDLAKLRIDGKFKSTILAEVAGAPDQLDVSILAREYVEKLGEVHDGVRALLKPSFDQAAAAIRQALDRYGEINNGNVIGVSVAEFDDAGRIAIAHQNIFVDLIERVERLVRRNRNLANLRLRYVTNEITPKRQKKRMRSDE